LMADHAEVIGGQWYWHAFKELEAEGHLDPASHKEIGGDACGRLSADGRMYLRSSADDSSETLGEPGLTPRTNAPTVLG
jgi:hypothetical protein